ncbi:hypothetical protein L596_013743 [Steinernema carpocapsae]|uniref:RING-CH-type domain-containing protein n=1 Tax=Steinernema carpocapsae TaxID=34508 RepID=A0A4U5P143_STECR|nr:hypothetical protein L596_013743 [Steinernema carpocapsae]
MTPPEENPFCRLCYGDASFDSLRSPCLCKGSMKHVHSSCQLRWMRTIGSSKCEVCDHFIASSGSVLENVSFCSICKENSMEPLYFVCRCWDRGIRVHSSCLVAKINATKNQKCENCNCELPTTEITTLIIPSFVLNVIRLLFLLTSGTTLTSCAVFFHFTSSIYSVDSLLFVLVVFVHFGCIALFFRSVVRKTLEIDNLKLMKTHDEFDNREKLMAKKKHKD